MLALYVEYKLFAPNSTACSRSEYFI